MMKYIKKPVIIEAFQLGIAKQPHWFIQNTHYVYHPEDGSIIVHTLEGDMKALVGDYIIKGVKGEIYPCKADIFHLTYAPHLES